MNLNESYKNRLRLLAGIDAEVINEGKFGKMVTGFALGTALAMGSPATAQDQNKPDTSINSQSSVHKDLEVLKQKNKEFIDSLISKGWKIAHTYKSSKVGEGAFKRFSSLVSNPKSLGNNIFTAPDDEQQLTSFWGLYHPEIQPTGVIDMSNGGFNVMIPIYD